MKQQTKKEEPLRFSVRTDLAIEARELAQQSHPPENDELDGVEVETQETPDFHLTRVRIVSENGSQLMGKPMGSYITIESEKLKENDAECHVPSFVCLPNSSALWQNWEKMTASL